MTLASVPTRILVASSALAALVLAADARAEFCRCDDTTFAWAGCRDDAAHCDQAGWRACVASPDDSYVVGAGCHVDVAPHDDILIEQPALPSHVRVDAGGSLTVHGPVEWRVGPGGFESLPGSRVELSGCFRRYGGSGEDCTDDLVADDLFAVGTVIPCRDGDCTGDAELVRIAYPNATPEQLAYLSRLDVARDVLCFWQNGEQGYIGADAGYCYKIAAVGVLPPAGYLDFDIRQVWRSQSDQAGYPLARRVVHSGTLRGDHPIGSRELHFEQTDVVDGRIDQMGRWVHCGTRNPYLIASVRDEPDGDVLVLADDRGIDASYASGEACYVDWGWAAGDLAFVMAPVHVTSSRNEGDTVYVRLGGAASLRAVVFDGLGGDGDHGRGAVQIIGGPLERFEHVWVADPLVNDREAVYLDDLPCDASVYHLTVTGGPAEPQFDKNYGLAWFGGPTCTYHLTHFYPRFQGDDSFVLESSGVDPVAGMVIRYMHSGPSSLPGDSGQLFDLGATNPSTIDAADVLCVACTTQEGIGQLVNPSLGGGTITRLLWVGAFNGGAIPAEPGPPGAVTHFQDFALVGSAVDENNLVGFGPLVGVDTDRFYVRDVTDRRWSSSQLCTSTVPPTQRLRHGVFENVVLGGTPCEIDGAAELSDVYFIDVAKSGLRAPLLAVQGGANGAILSRLSMSFRSADVGLSHGIEIRSGARARIDGPLLARFRHAASAMDIGGPSQAPVLEWRAPTCFYQNAVDDDEASLAAYATPPLRGVDPEFFSPPLGRFDLKATSSARAAGCGALDAGVRDDNWAHRKAKLRPLYMGPRSACGISAELAFVLVPLGRLLSRGSRAASRRAAGSRADGPSA